MFNFPKGRSLVQALWIIVLIALSVAGIALLWVLQLQESISLTLSAVRRDNPHGLDTAILETQKARNESLWKTCDFQRPYRTLSNVDKRTLLSHLVVENNTRMIYCYVPKVACSNWKNTIRQLQSPNSELAVGPHNSGLKLLSSFPDEEARDMLRTYFKFLFVRNPLKRLISAYRDKFTNEEYMQQRFGVDIIKECRKPPVGDIAITGKDVTFGEFVCYLLKHPIEEYNEHWMPAFKLCQPCSISYDFIGKYENLEDESNAVLRSRAADSGLRFPHRQAKYRPAHSHEEQKLLSELSPDMLQKLETLFDLDFSLFMYEKQSGLDYLTNT